MCSTKGLEFDRPNVFANVTNRELRGGAVWQANLLDPTQTELPNLTVEELGGILLGPLSKDVLAGFVTSYHELDVQALQHGNYIDPDNYHQLASQV